MEHLRRWEDLGLDCLSLVFQKVGLVSLLCDIPFVCYSWYKASLDSLCWQHINLHEFCEDKLSNEERFRNRYKVEEKNYHVGMVVRLIIARGRGNCTYLSLPATIADFQYKDMPRNRIRSPKLTSLQLKRCLWDDYYSLCVVLWNCEQLSELSLTQPTNLSGMINEIGDNCKNLHSLNITSSVIRAKEAFAISNRLQKLKKLSLQNCLMEQEQLEIIVSSCRNLEYLNVQCMLAGIWEEKKLRDLASHINVLKIDVSQFPSRYFINVVFV